MNSNQKGNDVCVRVCVCVSVCVSEERKRCVCVCVRARVCVCWESRTELTQGLYLAGKWWSRAGFVPQDSGGHQIVAAAPPYTCGACKQTPHHISADK